MLILRGVFAGWLIALMAWLIPASNKSSEVVLIGVLAYVVGLARLPHIIAGSVEVLYTILRVRLRGERTWATTCFGRSSGTLPAVSLAWLNQAQVASDSDDG